MHSLSTIKYFMNISLDVPSSLMRCQFVHRYGYSDSIFSLCHATNVVNSSIIFQNIDIVSLSYLWNAENVFPWQLRFRFNTDDIRFNTNNNVALGCQARLRNFQSRPLTQIILGRISLATEGSEVTRKYFSGLSEAVNEQVELCRSIKKEK